MCGKFTSKKMWLRVMEYSIAAAMSAGAEMPDGDETVFFGVMGTLPVIVWDAESGKRIIRPMRWGMAEARDWRTPQPMHARAETIDTKHPFKPLVLGGQRGIVIMETFNEGEEVPKPKGVGKNTIQWTIDPLDGQPRGFAFIWKRYQIADVPTPLDTCAMVTVPANELIRTKIAYNQEDPRMPAILDPDDWSTWLGEKDSSLDQLKAVLKTVEGADWKAEPAPKPKKGRNR